MTTCDGASVRLGEQAVSWPRASALRDRPVVVGIRPKAVEALTERLHLFDPDSGLALHP